ncbi:mannose-1-phosphate guanylyltransferase/mannose-6-phosphate isomerase [Caballeronia arationis]|nr:mannose-1-phosphate guanylyltransferase/mannose-6-phosphate isomerase [Caballeronia arationis]
MDAAARDVSDRLSDPLTTSDAVCVLPIRPVILAGGAGTRLWPISRKQFPKQLAGMLGAGSLLQMTIQRVGGLARHGVEELAPIVVCGDEHRFMTVQQLEEIGVAARLIVEPSSRNTAPALSLAALASRSEDQDCVLVVMPADHLIRDTEAFQRSVLKAASFAERGAIVSLGVRPTRAETGFGYVKLGASLEDGAHEIERFVEKPDSESAGEYLSSGAYWWNSGIFVVRASVWLNTLQRLQPSMHAACVAAYESGRADGACHLPDRESFDAVQGDSIDYAVMERLSREPGTQGVVVPLDAPWSDLGSWDAIWDAIWDALDKDEDGNVAKGRVVFEGSTSCYVQSEGRLIACVGVTNLAVIETADAVLVADRSRVQEVKSVVGRIADEHSPEVDSHRKVHRPWGTYDSIDKGSRFQVKRIVVRPGARLSLQLHHHRAEHWTVVSGTAIVTRGEESFLLSENESTYIPLGVKHRLENPGKVPLEIIEVQSGSYLGEDDIVRFDDKYGRAS